MQVKTSWRTDDLDDDSARNERGQFGDLHLVEVVVGEQLGTHDAGAKMHLASPGQADDPGRRHDEIAQQMTEQDDATDQVRTPGQVDRRQGEDDRDQPTEQHAAEECYR